mgnify:CR=1 FL=1|tara:strand:+ start:116 stop:445 length:330 start_codon:yes stop_codon:yes gene_type:complete
MKIKLNILISIVNKLIFTILILFLFNACTAQSTSILSSGAALVSGGSAAKTLTTTGTNIIIEKKTGKTALEHVAGRTIKDELRECEIHHSAELNEIFFVTLDGNDCVIK